MDIEKETMGQRARRLREGAGLSQAELAQKAGVSLMTIARLEAGRILVLGDFLQPIAEALGVTPNYLVSGQNDVQDQVDRFAKDHFRVPKVARAFSEYVKSAASFRDGYRLSDADLRLLSNKFASQRQLDDEIELFGLDYDVLK